MKKIINIFCGLLISVIAVSAVALPLNQRPAFQQFINTMVVKYHFQRSYLQKLFANYHPNTKILNNIQHPYEGASWEKYRATFVTKERIDGGVQ